MNPVRSEPLIAVGILSDTVVHFTLHGEYSGVPPASGLQGPCSVRPGAGCIVLTCGPKNYELRGSIELSPVDPARSLFTLEGVTVGERFHWEHKEDHTFAGGLRFISDGKKITAINTVPIEEYLASVISSEMSADASLEFLRAHAMTSRSWLLAQLEKLQAGKAGALRSPARVEDDDERIVWYDREDHADFDVCAGDHCQRYQGLTTARAPFVRRAVETTRGQVFFKVGYIFV